MSQDLTHNHPCKFALGARVFAKVSDAGDDDAWANNLIGVVITAAGMPLKDKDVALYTVRFKEKSPNGSDCALFWERELTECQQVIEGLNLPTPPVATPVMILGQFTTDELRDEVNRREPPKPAKPVEITVGQVMASLDDKSWATILRGAAKELFVTELKRRRRVAKLECDIKQIEYRQRTRAAELTNAQERLARLNEGLPEEAPKPNPVPSFDNNFNGENDYE